MLSEMANSLAPYATALVLIEAVMSIIIAKVGAEAEE
jgi:hypothetical protein